MPAMTSIVLIAMPGDFRDAHAAQGSILFVDGLIKTGSPHIGQVPQFSLLAVFLFMATILLRSSGPAQQPTAHVGKYQ